MDEVTSALDMPPYDYETPLIVDAERPIYGMLWTHVQTLQYRASLLEVRTGIRCRVVQVYEHNRITDEDETGRPPDPEETFEILTAHASAGPLEYAAALTWLDAFEEGANECRWLYSNDPSRF